MIALCLAAFALAGVPGEPSPEELAPLGAARLDLSLEQAWAAAAEAPRALLARTEADRGRAERLEARAWTNPSVDYQGYGRVQGTSDAINGQQHQLDLGLPLPITGELSARLRRGRLAQAVGEARAATRYALLAAEVGEAWLELLAAQEREAALAEAALRVDELVDLTRRRAAEGAARAWDVDRMGLAATSLRRQLAAARRDQQVTAARLDALVGGAGTAPIARGSLDRPLPLGPGPETTSPFEREARAVAEHQGAALVEARRARLPEPALQVGAYWTTDGDSRSVVGGLGWDVPLFDQGRGRVAAAGAARTAAEAEARQIALEVEAEREALRAALDELHRAALASEVPGGAVLAAAEVAWTEGEAGILELVDAVAAEVDQQLDAIDARLALRLAELRLALLDGALDAAIPAR